MGALAITAGCAVAPPARIILPAPNADHADGLIVDARPESAKLSHIVTDRYGSTEYLGDERFSVSPLVLVSDGMSQVSSRLKGKAVRLTMLQITLVTNSDGRVVPLIGSPVQWAVEAITLGALTARNSTRAACAHIIVQVESESFASSDCRPIDSGPVDDVVAGLIHETLGKIVGNLSASNHS